MYCCIVRAAKKYDSYGFEIEGWGDDVLVQAANLQTKSEQVLATMHEVSKSEQVLATMHEVSKSEQVLATMHEVSKSEQVLATMHEVSKSEQVLATMHEVSKSEQILATMHEVRTHSLCYYFSIIFLLCPISSISL